MSKKFPLGFWNYNSGDFFTGPEEVRRWAKLGMTMVTCPLMSDHEDPAKVREILDEVDKYGMTALLQIHGACSSEENFRAIYEKYAQHPAVAGFYIGEEPDAHSIAHYKETVQFMKKVAPNLIPYMNLGGMERTDRQMLCARQTFQEWLKEFQDDTQVGVMGFGNYALAEYSDKCTNDFYHDLRDFVLAAENAGVDLWATLLSSAHYWFRPQTKESFLRQLNACAASGCRGVLWFRIYDKPVAADYRNSPFNEYGEETPSYYALSEVQRHFNDHYGELFMQLHHKTTYHLTRAFGGYTLFPDNVHPLLKSVTSPNAPWGVESITPLDGVLGFFTDDEGYEYIAIVNNTVDRPGCFQLTFSKDTQICDGVHWNDRDKKNARPIVHTADFTEEVWLAPGQMEVFRIR